MLVVLSACPMDLNPINATMGDIGLRTLPAASLTGPRRRVSVHYRWIQA